MGLWNSGILWKLNLTDTGVRKLILTSKKNDREPTEKRYTPSVKCQDYIGSNNEEMKTQNSVRTQLLFLLCLTTVNNASHSHIPQVAKVNDPVYQPKKNMDFIYFIPYRLP